MHQTKLYISILLAIVLVSCGGQSWKENPVDTLLTKYKDSPKTEIILSDADVRSDKFYHTYTVVQPDKNADKFTSTKIKEQEVTEGFYALHDNNLGMSIARIDSLGSPSRMVAPAGFYTTVGNWKYGKWEDRNGQREWVYYPSYGYLSAMYFWGPRAIYRSQYYGDFRTSRGNRHYYGPAKQTSKWGTNSSGTKSTHANYHKRSVNRTSTWRKRYSSSSSSSRGGGGWGK